MPTRQELLKLLREQEPGLKNIQDDIILGNLFEINPDLEKQYPDNRMIADKKAADAEKRAREGSSFMQQVLSNPFGGIPGFWQQHPIMAEISRGGLRAIPVISAIGAGMAAAPETMGLATPGAVGLGGATGEGIRQLLAQGLGLEKAPGPTANAINMGIEGATSAVMPALASKTLKLPPIKPYMSVRGPGGIRLSVGLGGEEISPEVAKPINKYPSSFGNEGVTFGTNYGKYGPLERPQFMGEWSPNATPEIPMPKEPISPNNSAAPKIRTRVVQNSAGTEAEIPYNATKIQYKMVNGKRVPKLPSEYDPE